MQVLEVSYCSLHVRPCLLAHQHTIASPLHRVCALAPRRFLQCLQGWKQKLSEAGYDAIVYEDPLDMLLQQVQAILISPTGAQQWQQSVTE